MIVYGWNSKLIKHAPLEYVACKNCQEKNTLLGIHAHYVHLFWIPIFPYSKKASLVCTNCQQITSEKEMTPAFKGKVKLLKGAVGYPNYHFSGLAILLVLAGWLTFQSHNNEKTQLSYIQVPLSGDVYALKDHEEPSDYKYYFLKVQDIEGDSLVISPNSFYYTAIPSELDQKDGFYNYAIKMARNEFLVMQEKGELKKIIREYKDITGFNRTVEFAEEGAIVDLSEALQGN